LIKKSNHFIKKKKRHFLLFKKKIYSQRMTTVRIPPSPTGALHLGTARTALFNWLFAKKNNGRIIFRWEDTDKERSTKESETEILEGLAWLGMNFKAECEPKNLFFRQSENEQLHAQYIEKMWNEETIFPCFIPPEEIENQRKIAEEKHENFVFLSPFREEKKEALEEKIKSGKKFVWRIRCPKNKIIQFHDLIRGKIEVSTNTLGDFVIARGDGTALYLLANMIDDATQGVTHVIRGEDHISNTPKQIVIYEALNTTIPKFGHLPFVLDQNRKKLSKRNVDSSICVTIKDFQAAGFVPEAVINGLALLGWNPKTTEEIFSFEELCNIFEIKNVNPGAAQYNFKKMKWFNAQWIKKLSPDKLRIYANQFTQKNYNENEEKNFYFAREKSRDLAELITHTKYLRNTPNITWQNLINEKFEITESLIKKILPEIIAMLEKIPEENWSAETIKNESQKKTDELNIKSGQFLNPFRIALSGKEVSIGPFEICEAVGKTEAISRIRNITF